MTSYNAAGAIVRNSEYEFASALVGKGCAVFHKALAAEGLFGLFELEMLVFRRGHPLCECNQRYGHLAPYLSSEAMIREV